MKPENASMSSADWSSSSAIADAVSSRKMSALDVTNGALMRITVNDGKLNSFTDVVAERARATATRIDATVASGGHRQGLSRVRGEAAGRNSR